MNWENIVKSRVSLVFQMLIACVFIQTAQAADPTPETSTTRAQDSEARIQALQEALSDAKERVSKLETELQNAHNDIERLKTTNTGGDTDNAIAPRR